MTRKTNVGARHSRGRRWSGTRYGGIALGLLLATSIGAPPAAAATAPPEVLVRKSPSCGCCAGWAAYLLKEQFKVAVENVEKMDLYKKLVGVPEKLQACHTATVAGYIIEGHVPAASIRKLLAEKPKARGIAVPGMPSGVPGMGGERKPFTVYIFGHSGKAKVYAEY